MNGQCVEIPSEPDERHSSLCAKIKLKSYPMVKIGDVLWTYMGDPATTPDLPQWEFARVPAQQSFTSKRWQECNWLQAPADRRDRQCRRPGVRQRGAPGSSS